MRLKLLQKERFKKQQKQLDDLIRNKIADKITRSLKNSPHNDSVTNEEEILRERYTSPEERKNAINDDLRSI